MPHRRAQARSSGSCPTAQVTGTCTFETGMTNVATEGCNRKVKQVKRVACDSGTMRTTYSGSPSTPARSTTVPNAGREGPPPANYFDLKNSGERVDGPPDGSARGGPLSFFWFPSHFLFLRGLPARFRLVLAAFDLTRPSFRVVGRPVRVVAPAAVPGRPRVVRAWWCCGRGRPSRTRCGRRSRCRTGCAATRCPA